MSDNSTELRCGTFVLDLSQPVVMGVLNVTPDSFSDGGSFVGQDKALSHAGRMLVDGAAIIDVGGESTRPGASPISVQEELDRVVPIVEVLVKEFACLISVDSSAPEVILAAEEAGAGFINDVRSLQRPGALEAVAKLDLPICLMHMQGQPGSMQNSPVYKDVVTEVGAYLMSRTLACENAGMDKDRIAIDPGIGFGKTQKHNLALLKS